MIIMDSNIFIANQNNEHKNKIHVMKNRVNPVSLKRKINENESIKNWIRKQKKVANILFSGGKRSIWTTYLPMRKGENATQTYEHWIGEKNVDGIKEF